MEETGDPTLKAKIPVKYSETFNYHLRGKSGPLDQGLQLVCNINKIK